VPVVAVTMSISGCAGKEQRVAPPAAIPLARAVAVVNDNIAAVGGTLRAVGWVDGSFVDADGHLRSYNVDAVLFYLEPGHVRFDLKSFGTRRFLFGSNGSRYWFYDQSRDVYQCGRHDAEDELSADMPIKPRQLVDALGLSFMSDRDAADGTAVRMVQRVGDQYQQVLFMVSDGLSRPLIEKEYWLDRFPPRLVRRVVFRNGNGEVELESQLDDYRAIEPGGATLPSVMVANWPESMAHMRFRVGKWAVFGQVGPDSPQFETPAECE
jgi:hypothetical protein